MNLIVKFLVKCSSHTIVNFVLGLTLLFDVILFIWLWR